MSSSVLDEIQGRLGVWGERLMESAVASLIVDTNRFQSVRSSAVRALYRLEMEWVKAVVMVGSLRWEDLSRGGARGDGTAFNFSRSWATSSLWSVLPSWAPRYTRQLVTLDFQRLEMMM